MPSDLEPRLRALHRAPAPGQDEHRRAHEPAVLAAFASRHGGATGAPRVEPRRSRWWRLRWPRIALGGVLGLAVAAGACALPAEYPVSLGYALEITVDASATLDEQAIAHRVRELPGAERVELRVERRVEQGLDEHGQPVVDDRTSLRLFVFGETLDPDQLWDDLREDFPVLVDAEIHEVPLAGTVHGTLGGKLSHRLLDVTLDRHGVEEAERRILAELVADGIAPEDATIDIEQSVDAQGNRRIEVRVEAERGLER